MNNDAQPYQSYSGSGDVQTSFVGTSDKPFGIRTSRLSFFVLFVIFCIPMLGIFFPFETYLLSFNATVSPDQPATVAEVGSSTRNVLIVTAVLIVFFYARSLPAMIPVVRQNWLLFAFVAWCFVTALWSDVPGYSFNRSGRLLLLVLFAIYITETMGERELTRMICLALLCAILASTLATIIVPDLSRAGDARGAWRGAFHHKNYSGAVSAIGVLFAIHALRIRALSLVSSMVLLLGSFAFLVAANSISSVVGLAAGIGCAVYVGAHRRRPSLQLGAHILFGMSAISFLCVLAYLNQDTVLDALGRDPTLTGRARVWHFAEELINSASALGYGHGAWSSPRIQDLTKLNVGWPTPHAHNTLLDLRLQLGLPGLVLGLLVFLVAVKRSLVLARSHGSDSVVWLALLVGLGLRAHSETIVVDPATGEMLWLALAYVVPAKMMRHTAQDSLAFLNSMRPAEQVRAG